LVKVAVGFKIPRPAVMRLVAEADARPNRLTERVSVSTKGTNGRFKRRAGR
jgi:hypothetical protein